MKFRLNLPKTREEYQRRRRKSLVAKELAAARQDYPARDSTDMTVCTFERYLEENTSLTPTEIKAANLSNDDLTRNSRGRDTPKCNRGEVGKTTKTKREQLSATLAEKRAHKDRRAKELADFKKKHGLSADLLAQVKKACEPYVMGTPPPIRRRLAGAALIARFQRE